MSERSERALGVCLFLMVTSFFLFGGTNPTEIWSEIRLGTLWKNQMLEQEPMLHDLLKQMLNWDIRWRIRLSEIPQHPWMRISSRILVTSKSDHWVASSAGCSNTLRRSQSLVDDTSLTIPIQSKPSQRPMRKRIFGRRITRR